MDLMKIATQLFMQKLGGESSGLVEAVVSKALKALLGGEDGNIDLGAIVSKLSGSGLASLAQSWLGDGDNSSISAEQVLSLFGESKIGEFASSLNVEKSTATEGLASMLPELIDKNSSSGNLLGGDGGGLLGGIASSLFD